MLGLLVRLAERLENAPFGAQVVQSRALIGTLPEARRQLVRPHRLVEADVSEMQGLEDALPVAGLVALHHL